MKFLLRVFNYLTWRLGSLENHDVLLIEHFYRETKYVENPFLDTRNLYYFSQADEVGILNELLKQVEFKEKGRFLEFGVGDGTENNSLNFLLEGWEVWWFGNENLSLEIPKDFSNLKYTKEWITLDWIKGRAKELCRFAPNIVSVDLDGNDYHVTKVLLENGLNPQIWVQEYNATFGPKAKWIMPYEEFYVWDASNNWGASFASFVELFELYGYSLVTCNLTGVNAFFIQKNLYDSFLEQQKSTKNLYRPYKPWLLKSKQKVSSKLLYGIQ